MSVSSEELFESLENTLKVSRNLVGELTWYPEQEEALKELERALLNLKGRFKIVVVGDYNSGKSYFINTLLGDHVCKVSDLPETSHIHIYTYGVQGDQNSLEDPVWLHHKLNPVLEHFDLVDTPGLNSGDSEQSKRGDFHGDRTREFIPHADLVFYLTSIGHSWSGSGRELLQYIYNEKCKQVVFVLNKIDIFDEPDALDQRTPDQKIDDMIAQVKLRCREKLKLDPPIFAISAIRAFRAKMTKPPTKESISLLQKSRFNEIMDYIQKALNDEGKIRLKLLASLLMGQERVRKIRECVEEELKKALLRKNQLEKELNDLQEMKKAPYQLQNELKEKAEFFLKEKHFEEELSKECHSYWKSLRIGAKVAPPHPSLERSAQDLLDHLTQKLSDTLDLFEKEVHQKLGFQRSWSIPKAQVELSSLLHSFFIDFTRSYFIFFGGVFLFLLGILLGWTFFVFVGILMLAGGAYFYWNTPLKHFQLLREELIRVQRTTLSPFREHIQEELAPLIQKVEISSKEEWNLLRQRVEEFESQQEQLKHKEEAMTDFQKKLEIWRG